MVGATANYIVYTAPSLPGSATPSGSNVRSNSPMLQFLWFGRQVDTNSLKADYTRNWNSSYYDNPFWSASYNTQSQERHRLIGDLHAEFRLTDGLNVRFRTSTDWYNDRRKSKVKWGSAGAGSPYGSYAEDAYTVKENNTEVLATYIKQLNKNWGIDALLGFNVRNKQYENNYQAAPRLAVADLYTLTNSRDPLTSSNDFYRLRQYGLYGSIQLDYRRWAFLNITGRNDWSSTLPVDNNSYFYPSASLSAVLTDLFDIRSNILTFAKVRTSTSMVRRDLEPYQTASNFIISQGWGGNSTATANNNYPNPDIKPEKVVSYEFGGDFRFFNSRVGIDVAYYKSITTDLIIPITLNPSAGYDTKLMNVGKMTNQGIELMVNVVPVRTKDLEWSLNFNFSKNKNKVVALAEDKGISRIRQIERWASLELRTENTKGDGSYGSLYGDYLVYKDGQLQLKNGLPVEENGDWGYLGNVNPDWTGGLGTDFKYKNWTFSALFGFQHGGSVYSRTYIEGMRNGSLKESLAWRDADGAGMIVADGIDVETGQKNTVAVPVRNYVQAYYDNDMIATFDASYVKLRELKIGYTLPKKWLKNTPLKNVSVSAFGRNLFIWTDVPNIDPEVASYDGQLKGIETMSLPSTRSFGFNLNVTL